jgi:hypothetical protein
MAARLFREAHKKGAINAPFFSPGSTFEAAWQTLQRPVDAKNTMK